MTLRLLAVMLVVGVLFATDSRGLAQAGRAFTTNFTTQEFAARRAKVYDAIGPEAVALMQGLPSVHSSAVFRQSNEFFYLSGVVAPQALLLMDGAAGAPSSTSPSRTPAARPPKASCSRRTIPPRPPESPASMK